MCEADALALAELIGGGAYPSEYAPDKYCVIYIPFRETYYFASKADWHSYQEVSHEMGRLKTFPSNRDH